MPKPAYAQGLSNKNDGMNLDIPSEMFKTHTVVHFGGDGETRTLAPVSRPTPLAGEPLHQLGYISKY